MSKGLFFTTDKRRRSKGRNIFLKGRNRNKNKDNLNKSDRLMEGVGVWTSFYRANPHRFVEDYLGIKLRLFQQILLWAMMHNNYFMYLASRGQGKTFLVAIYAVVRSILFPKEKIIVASGVKSQSRAVIEKIKEIYDDAPLLKREVSNWSENSDDPFFEFHNGSWIRTVTANENARSKRANLLIIDEFVKVDIKIITSVLRRFLTAERQPGYLRKPEYAHMTERNQEIYLSSAWYKHHWSFKRMQAFFNSMMSGRQYFVCGLPYQLSIKENLLNREQVEDEMQEDDFDQTLFGMEMECLFFGESEKAFFKYEDLEPNRQVPQAIYPKDFYNLIKDPRFRYPKKEPEEVRLLSCDIAGMGGSDNDSSIFSLIKLTPTGRGYDRTVSYIESMDGGHTETQAIRIKQLFYDFDCDYLVLDTQNMGLSVYDLLTIPLTDRERGIEYEPWTCINDTAMAERCIYPNAKSVIYSIKASASLNSEMAISLKDGLGRGKVRLLLPESEANELLGNIKGYSKLSPEIKFDLEAPFVQTTLFINEVINLEGERNNLGQIKLTEPRSGRKDRYSSISYGNHIANVLERQMMSETQEADASDWIFNLHSGF